VKNIYFCAAVAIVSFSSSVLLTGTVSAQSSNVCVVDVATVFKNHSDFNTRLHALQTEAEQFKAYLQSEVIKLQTMAEQLKAKPVSAPDYNQLESTIAEANAKLMVEKNAKTREFVMREAKLHFETYVRTTNAVASICNQKNIRMVLQYSSIPMDLANPQSVMQRVNSEIVYHAPQKDITQDVISLMNQGGPRVGNTPTSNR